MKDLCKYLKWEITEKGVRITKCDKAFKGAMAIPNTLDGVPVVEIGEEAFEDCSLLKSVVIPDSVEVIGENAFSECSGLEELRLGAGVKKIEDDAFDSEVTLVVDAGSYAEQWCVENNRKHKVR